MTHVLATTLLHDADPQVRRSAAQALDREACSDEDEQFAAVESLIGALNDPHVVVQEAAMASLLTFEPTHVAPRILPALHSTVQHRNLAVEILQQLGPTILPILFHAIVDSDEHVRKFLVDIIGRIGGPAAVEGLLAYLHDTSPNVRAAIIESLGLLGDRRAVEPLILMMKDPEEWVVFSAINALGNLQDTRAVASLRDLLDGHEPAILCAVVEALGKIGDSQVLPDLLTMLPVAKLPLRHLLFVTIIELMGEQADVFQREELKEYLFSELVQALKTRDPDVQLAALHGLRLLGNAKATDALLRFLEVHRGGEEEIESAVLHALIRIGDEKKLLQAAMQGSERVALVCIDALSNRQATQAAPALGKLVVQSDNREIRRAALTALGRIGIQEAGTDAVVSALNDRSGCVRIEAAKIVATEGIQGSAHALWHRLDREPYPDVIVEQVRAIVSLESPNGTAALDRLLAHSRPEVREAAIVHWPDIASQSVRTLLEQRVMDPDWRVRLAIVERWLLIQDEGLVERLIAASADPHPHVRQTAIQGLGHYSGKAVCATLRGVVAQDTDMWVRTRAVEQLVNLQDRGACPFLIQNLTDAPIPLQMAILKALGEMGDSSMVGILQEMQHHQEPEIKETARLAIRQLMATHGQPEVMR